MYSILVDGKYYYVVVYVDMMFMHYIPVLCAFSETHGWVCFVPPSWSVSPLYFTVRMAWSIECAAVRRPSWNTGFGGVIMSAYVFQLFLIHVWRTFLEILGAQPSLSQSAPVGLFFITCTYVLLWVDNSIGDLENERFFTFWFILQILI